MKLLPMTKILPRIPHPPAVASEQPIATHFRRSSPNHRNRRSATEGAMKRIQKIPPYFSAPQTDRAPRESDAAPSER
jgi:hypothetical protein